MTRDLDHAATSERAGRALRPVDVRRALQYAELRLRLRMSVPQVAAETGYSEGYVGRWAHGGLTAVPVPPSAVRRLEELLLERALSDLEHLRAAGIRDIVQIPN